MGTPPRATPRVLVCEDDAAMRALIVTTLRDAGLEVEQATEGADGLAMARAVRPDVIVADWLMPHLDGIALCSAVRHDASVAHARVVIVTGRHEPAYAQLARDAGAEAVVTKPFDPAALVAILCGTDVAPAPADDGAREDDALRAELERLLPQAERGDVPVTLAGVAGTDAPGAPAALAQALSQALGPDDALFRVAALGECAFALLAPGEDDAALATLMLRAVARRTGVAGLRCAALRLVGGSPDEALAALAAKLGHVAA
jgi:CheY-like chemotaxis protein